uniref:Elongation factor 4 n=2 Tax=Lygus hesperus TaxID=30085 RepID=A0A0A9XXK4_LYGHE
MSTVKTAQKPIKVKKCIAMLNCLQNSITENREFVRNIHDKIVEAMKQKNPEFPDESLDEDVACSEAPTVVDQETQVSIEELNESMEVDRTEELIPQPEAHNLQEEQPTNGLNVPSQIVSCSSQAVNGCPTPPPNVPSTNGVRKSRNRSQFDPSVVIKVEDSGSDDSSHSEEAKVENLVHKMMAPFSAPLNHASPKAFLHYVVIENLPIRTTADEVVNELFIGLIGISREDVTGITVHNEKTESIAQIYFKDLKHVQRILVFSGKLVYKGRVITSKIGMS